MPPTRVVKIQRKGGKIVQDCDVYIGGRCNMGGWNLPESKWDDRYLGKTEAGLKIYEAEVRENEELMEALPELRGKVLGCWCKKSPGDRCHGDVLVRLVQELELSSGPWRAAERAEKKEWSVEMIPKMAKISRIYGNIVDYCLLPFLGHGDLFELRTVSKVWKMHSDGQLARELQTELKNPELGVKDALWYYGLLMSRRAKITVSAATVEFRVVPRKVAPLPYEIKENMTHGGTMRLVQLRDVLRLCLERHKSAEKFLKYEEKLAVFREIRSRKKADSGEVVHLYGIERAEAMPWYDMDYNYRSWKTGFGR